MPTTQEHIVQAQKEFEKICVYFKGECARLHIGRASPALVEDLKIEAYGSMQPLKSIASISVPDVKTLQIQAWDKSLLAVIERAIQESKLGLNPINDGRVLRIAMPPLTEERRKELVKVVHQMAENGKIAVRTARATAHSAFKELETNKEISEDQRRMAEKHLQEKVDEVNKEIEQIGKRKEEEIMTI